MSRFDKETDEVVLDAVVEGKRAGETGSRLQGANIGIVNGSLVGYDVGYWSGFAGELTRLLDQNLDQADNDRKTAIIRRCCVNVEKAALAVPLDADDETITDRLKELKVQLLCS